MSDLKRGDKVEVCLEGQVLNMVGENNVGVRITDKRRPAYWSVVPTYAVRKIKDE